MSPNRLFFNATPSNDAQVYCRSYVLVSLDGSTAQVETLFAGGKGGDSRRWNHGDVFNPGPRVIIIDHTSIREVDLLDICIYAIALS